ncbi:MAG: M24 family metallopeptidase [Solirubrobacteraceae bacterium]
MRIGAAMTDDAVHALQQHAAPGVSELELSYIVERAYVARGGTTHIHYFGATAMSEPDVCAPAQYPTARPLAPVAALVCEISASYWEYTGLLLRTFAIADEPTPLYQELHPVADVTAAAGAPAVQVACQPAR